VAQVRLARAETPWRMVRLTRSINAVFSRPEKPILCKAAVRASAVPRRIAGVTRTSLRQRSAFFHLAIDQTSRHLPLSHDPPAMTSCEPVAKMGCQRIKIQV
jgi:hypothetical protein